MPDDKGNLTDEDIKQLVVEYYTAKEEAILPNSPEDRNRFSIEYITRWPNYRSDAWFANKVAHAAVSTKMKHLAGVKDEELLLTNKELGKSLGSVNWDLIYEPLIIQEKALAIAKAQLAKVIPIFKARQEQAVEAARQAGIREVVEWILANHVALREYDLENGWLFDEDKQVALTEKWQAKLKEWGIE